MSELIKTAQDLPVGQDGLVKFENVKQQLLWADSMIRSGMLPKSYKQPSEVVAAMAMAAEVGLRGGITTLRRTANINGTPSMFGELPLAVVQASGQLRGLEAYYLDDEGKKIHPSNGNLHKPKVGFFCHMKRANGTEYYDIYTLEEANKAGLGPVWRKHPEDMLRWRTIGKVIKTLFADIVSGAPIAEYDFNTMGGVEKESFDLNHMNDSIDMNSLNDIADTGEIVDEKIERKEAESKKVELEDIEDAEIVSDVGAVKEEFVPVEDIGKIIGEESSKSVLDVSFPKLGEKEIGHLKELLNMDLEAACEFEINMGDDKGKALGTIPKPQLKKRKEGLKKYILDKEGDVPSSVAQLYAATVRLIDLM